MEYYGEVNNSGHFSSWRDASKYHGDTLYTTETMQSVLDEFIPVTEKFFIANHPAYLEDVRDFDKCDEHRRKTFKCFADEPPRRREITRKEVQAIISSV